MEYPQVSLEQVKNGFLVVFPCSPRERRQLQRLFDSIDINGTKSIREQLKSIIENASELDKWRKILIETPKGFAYCKKHNNRIRLIMGRNHYVFLHVERNVTGYGTGSPCLPNSKIILEL